MMGLQTAGIVGAIALAVGAAGGFGAGLKWQDGQVQRAKAATVKMTGERDNWRTASKAWEANFREAERLRGQEARTAVGAVNSANASCTQRVAAARASERALKGLMARPVKTDPKGCPIPGLWTAKDLAPVLRPEVR